MAPIFVRRDLQFITIHADTVALTVRSSCWQRMSFRCFPIQGTNAEPSSVDGCMNSALKLGLYSWTRYWFAASISVIPWRANSWSWWVRKARSLRPLENSISHSIPNTSLQIGSPVVSLSPPSVTISNRTYHLLPTKLHVVFSQKGWYHRVVVMMAPEYTKISNNISYLHYNNGEFQRNWTIRK